MQPGDKIGRYLLEKQIGEGAMSVVFVREVIVRVRQRLVSMRV